MARRSSSNSQDEPRTALARVLDAQGRRLIWVASRIGVDASTVSRWRSGERSIPARRAAELAAVLGVAIDELTDRPAGAGSALPGGGHG